MQLRIGEIESDLKKEKDFEALFLKNIHLASRQKLAV
jgi:hypothetical protein